MANRRNMIKRDILAIFHFFVWLIASLQIASAQEKFERQTLMLNNLERSYFVHYPQNIRPSEPKALLFVLHGGNGSDAQTMASRTKMNMIADRENFVVIYPAGIDGQWNDGRGKTFRRAEDNSDIDDVAFISNLIDNLVKVGIADSNRIYVMGLSNGGMMTYRLGIEIGNKLAAIAAVIANIPVKISKQSPSSPLSVLIMNGTADPLVPWDGGSVRVLGKKYGEVLSTDQSVRFWVSVAGLPQEPKTEYLDDLANDGCSVEMDRYSVEGKQYEVVLYRIKGGGHNLPGGNTPDRPLLVGTKCMDIDGSEHIWAFFKKHIRSTPTINPDNPNSPKH